MTSTAPQSYLAQDCSMPWKSRARRQQTCELSCPVLAPPVSPAASFMFLWGFRSRTLLCLTQRVIYTQVVRISTNRNDISQLIRNIILWLMHLRAATCFLGFH